MIDLTKAATVFIGRRGEHHFRNIGFDVSSLLGGEYPGETLTAIYKRPDGTAYPVATSYTTGVLTWSPSATDTINAGVGQLEIRVVSGDVVGKSVKVITIVEEALADGIAPPPEPPAQEWLNQVLSALAALNNSSNHCFAQIVICGNCGEVFRRVHWSNRGKKSIVWRCVSRLENTGLFCDARTVLESTIEQVLVTAIKQALCDKDSFLSTLQDNIATIITHESDQALADIDKRLEELQTELLKLATSNADYDKVGDEIHQLRDQKQKIQLENVNREELKKRIADMSTFLKKQSTVLIEYDEQLVRRLIEKVTVYEDKFTVEFKSGLTVDINE